jgi:hypothetical protein
VGQKFSKKWISFQSKKTIGKDVDVNQGLWDIAERIANIKEPSLALAA